MCLFFEPVKDVSAQDDDLKIQLKKMEDMMVRALAELDALDEIHLTWAGHTLLGGTEAPTITGPLGDHLPASLEFELTHFEPLDNGECFLSYRRKRRPSPPS